MNPSECRSNRGVAATMYRRHHNPVLLWICQLIPWILALYLFGCGGTTSTNAFTPASGPRSQSAEASVAESTLVKPEGPGCANTPETMPDIPAVEIDTVSTASNPANLPNYHSMEELLHLIEMAGIDDYAAFGRSLLRAGKVKIVSPPDLPENYNAYAWIREGEIWINTPMFQRYPNIIDQATIFLHEMVHIKWNIVTHEGPMWHVLSDFRRFYNEAIQGAEVSGPFGAPEARVVNLPAG